MSYPNTQLLINNQWQDAASGKTLPVVNPATGEKIGTVAHASTADLDRALAAAEAGLALWRNTTAMERSKAMRKAAVLLRERVMAIAEIMTQEQGKPLAEAKAEVLNGAEVIEFCAEEARRVYGRIVPSRHMGGAMHVLKEPVGIVAAFTPWNFPINQVVRKLSAALAAGCSIIVKAPEETPASPAALLQAFVDAGVPAGVMGLVYGNPAEISNYLIAHASVRKITFTGSTPVGKMLSALAGQHMKRATMELGGHAPVIVDASADVAQAVKHIAGSKFRNAGQVCISPTRFLVHNSVKKQFVEGFAAYSESLKIGNGLSEGTQMGPLANSRRVPAMERLVADALANGAKLITGGKKLPEQGAGNFYAPTVLDDVPLTAAIYNEEPFGPVASVHGFDSLDEMLAEANRLPWGLASYAFTQDLKSLHKITHGMQAGLLWINHVAGAWAEMPFGGVKDSGYGSEGGPEAIEAYLTTKSVNTLFV